MNLNLTRSRRWRLDAVVMITRESTRLVDVPRQFRDCTCSTQVRALEGGSSTTKQILIDQDLRGWKEVEYEVLRQRPVATA